MKEKKKPNTPGALLVVDWRRGRGLRRPLGCRVLLRHFPHATEVAAVARYVKRALADARSHPRDNEYSRSQGPHAASAHKSAHAMYAHSVHTKSHPRPHPTTPHTACHTRYVARPRPHTPPQGSGHAFLCPPGHIRCTPAPRSLDGKDETNPTLSPSQLSQGTQTNASPPERTGRTGTSHRCGVRPHTSMARKSWHDGTC